MGSDRFFGLGPCGLGLACALLASCSPSTQTARAAPPREELPPTLESEPAQTPPALAPEAPLTPASGAASPADGGRAPLAAERASSSVMSDEQIAGFTEAVNAGELEQAKLATLTSKRSEVKKLAAMLIAHHGDALQKQAKLALKTADSPATSQLGVDAADARKKLDGSSGADFDRVFVAAQVDVHRKVLSVLLSQLLPNARNPALRAYIEELKPKLEQHLESAEQLQKEFPPLLVTTSAAPTKSGK